MSKTVVNASNLADHNAQLQGKSPEEIAAWAFSVAKNPVVTTNFRPYEASILHLLTQIRPDVRVLFVDSGYNTLATYKYAQKLIKDLNLNVKTYVPAQTRAFRDAQMGGIPDVDSPLHEAFTEQVKLEPFRRALGELDPDVWFNAIRKDQTEFRAALDVLSLSKDGILKVAPLFYLSDADLDAYQARHNLPNEFDYFDPTKVLERRECGLHTNL